MDLTVGIHLPHPHEAPAIFKTFFPTLDPVKFMVNYTKGLKLCMGKSLSDHAHKAYLIAFCLVFPGAQWEEEPLYPKEMWLLNT